MRPEHEWARRVLAAAELADLHGEGEGADRVGGLIAGMDHDWGKPNRVRQRLRLAAGGRGWKRDEFDDFLEDAAKATDFPLEYFRTPYDIRAVIRAGLNAMKEESARSPAAGGTPLRSDSDPPTGQDEDEDQSQSG